MEMMQVRLWQAETLDGEFEEDDVDGKFSVQRDSKIIVLILLLIEYSCTTDKNAWDFSLGLKVLS